jgi:hypothetical protein
MGNNSKKMKNLLFVKTGILLVCIVLLAGCKHYNLPNEFPDVEEMSNILTDLQIAESSLSHLPGLKLPKNDNQQGYYKYVLKKYGYTTADFDTIRKWYVQHPELYVKVYDRVLVKLSEKEASAKVQSEQEKEIEQKELNRKEMERQIKNLWQDSLNITLNIDDSIATRLPFLIKSDTLDLHGRLRLSATYKFMKEDASRQPQLSLSVWYADSTADSIKKLIPHSFNEKNMELELAIRDSLSPSRIEGFLLDQDTKIRAVVQISNIFLEIIKDTTILKEKKPSIRPEHIKFRKTSN